MKKYYAQEFNGIGDRVTHDIIADNTNNDVNIKFYSSDANIFKYKANFTFISEKYKEYDRTLTILYNVDTDIFSFEGYKSYTINNVFKKLDANNDLGVFNYFNHDDKFNIGGQPYKYSNLLNFCEIAGNVNKLDYYVDQYYYFNQSAWYIWATLSKSGTLVNRAKTMATLIYKYNNIYYMEFNLAWTFVTEDNKMNLRDEGYTGMALFDAKNAKLIFTDIFFNNPTPTSN